VERATLLGVVQQQMVVVQCPLLQGLPVQISLLISPVRMMAVSLQPVLQDEEGLVADLCWAGTIRHIYGGPWRVNHRLQCSTSLLC